jgi:hypothetical protein
MNFKRTPLLLAVFALVVSATPGPDHKVFWCHYPPGQWTGDPTTSKVLILSIDQAAEPGHLGHSPLLSDGVTPAEGVTSDGTETGNCPSLIVPTFSLTIQKEFNDGITVSPDLLGWGMNVTDQFGATTHYVTDAQSGQVSVPQLPVGTYTVREDPSGPVPPGCVSPLFNPFQAFLNGVAQTPGPVTFT